MGDQGTFAQMELAHIGNRFNRSSGVGGPFRIQPARQWSKAFGFEHLPHRRWAQGALALVESPADVVDGVILFAQLDDQLASGRFFGLSLWAAAWANKEQRIRIPAEVVAKNMEGAWRVTELMSDFFGRLALDEIRTQGLVLTLSGMAGLLEETAHGT